MKATKRSQYALRALIFLAKEKGKTSPLRAVSEKEGISFDYLEKIFGKLEKKGIVVSRRGAFGGYLLAKSPNKITLKDIFDAVGEPIVVVDCIDKSCPRDSNCRASGAWKEVNKKLEKALLSIKLSELIK